MSTSVLPSLIKTFELPIPEIGPWDFRDLFYRSPYGPEVIVRDFRNAEDRLANPGLVPGLVVIADFSDSLVPIVTIPDVTTVLDVLNDPFMLHVIRTVGHKATGSFVQIYRNDSEALKVLHSTRNLYVTNTQIEYF